MSNFELIIDLLDLAIKDQESNGGQSLALKAVKSQIAKALNSLKGLKLNLSKSVQEVLQDAGIHIKVALDNYSPEVKKEAQPNKVAEENPQLLAIKEKEKVIAALTTQAQEMESLANLANKRENILSLIDAHEKELELLLNGKLAETQATEQEKKSELVSPPTNTGTATVADSEHTEEPTEESPENVEDLEPQDETPIAPTMTEDEEAAIEAQKLEAICEEFAIDVAEKVKALPKKNLKTATAMVLDEAKKEFENSFSGLDIEKTPAITKIVNKINLQGALPISEDEATNAALLERLQAVWLSKYEQAKSQKAEEEDKPTA